MIPDEMLRATHITEAELRRETAALLFSQWKWSIGRACEFSGMDRLHFQRFLASRGIPVHYTPEGLEEDLRAMEKLHRS
ncbi:MAG: UPF0175 family protein [Candidatus Sumerlaeota bacterium]|nr:UPF0175 family protein [Candidatus Sumerlaeota bacterium]